MRYLLFVVLAAFTLSPIADTPEETDASGGLPIWLLYQASVGAAACVPPGTAITDSNFEPAIMDWIARGNGSEYGDITKWCTGAVTDMNEAFKGKTSFDADISGWDTSNVTDMSVMFFDARGFNQDISGWNTSKVTSMYNTFAFATDFNQNIGGWDTSKVADMAAMFEEAEAFNQNIGGWDTSKVEDMFAMFYDADAFNQDLSSWDASLVTSCILFAGSATAWLAAYGGSISGKTPPLSASLIAAGCGD